MQGVHLKFHKHLWNWSSWAKPRPQWAFSGDTYFWIPLLQWVGTFIGLFDLIKKRKHGPGPDQQHVPIVSSTLQSLLFQNNWFPRIGQEPHASGQPVPAFCRGRYPAALGDAWECNLPTPTAMKDVKKENLTLGNSSRTTCLSRNPGMGDSMGSFRRTGRNGKTMRKPIWRSCSQQWGRTSCFWTARPSLRQGAVPSCAGGRLRMQLADANGSEGRQERKLNTRQQLANQLPLKKSWYGWLHGKLP